MLNILDIFRLHMWLADYASMEGNYFLCFPVFAIGSGCGGKEIILFSNQLPAVVLFCQLRFIFRHTNLVTLLFSLLFATRLRTRLLVQLTNGRV